MPRIFDEIGEALLHLLQHSVQSRKNNSVSLGIPMDEDLQRARWRHGWSGVLAAALAAAVIAIGPASGGSLGQQTEVEATAVEPVAYRQAELSGRRARTSEAALASLGERMNANTIAVISGNLNATYLSIAYDLSAVLDDGDAFRVLPVIGKGGGQNIRDVRFLKGVDLGITQSNLLGYYQRTNEIGRVDDKISYLAKLFNEEMHVVVRADSGITSMVELDGKRVNFSDIGSGTQLTTRDVFRRLGIEPVEVNMGQADAFEKLKTGEITATVLIAGKPTASMAKVAAEPGLRLVPVEFAKPLQDDYLPATLTSQDYPNLIPPGTSVETVAVGAVLFAYNWPRNSERYRRIEAFIERFFPRLAEFQKPPRHPKWRETNLAAVVPGWTRFPAAEEWIRRNAPAPAPQEVSRDASREEFERFLAKRNTGGETAAPDDRNRLFEEFLRWSETRAHR
jgi:TRAP transporter TAXI family solute receptor